MTPPPPSDHEGPAPDYQPSPTTITTTSGPPGYGEDAANRNTHDVPPPPPPPAETDDLPSYGEALGTRLVSTPTLQRSRTAPSRQTGPLSAAQEKTLLQSQLESDEALALNLQREEQASQITEDAGLARAARGWAHELDWLPSSSRYGTAQFASARRGAAGADGTFTGFQHMDDNTIGRVNGGMGIDPRLAKKQEEKRRKEEEKERKKSAATLERRATIAAPEGAADRRAGGEHADADDEAETNAKKKGKGKEAVRKAGRWLADAASGYGKKQDR